MSRNQGNHRKPLVSVVVPCRNEREHIRDFLENLVALEHPEGGVEFLLVDGMSEDDTRELVGTFAREHAEIRLLENPRRITPSALNLGIREARGEIIVRMDVHARYAKDYIVRCVDVLKATGADNVGGPWRPLVRNNTNIQRAIAAAFSSRFGGGSGRGHRNEYSGPVDTVYLGCWRKSTFESFGLFDEDLVRNQDDEHNLRITKAGGIIYQTPKIRCWYTPRPSLGGLFRQYWQYGYWKVRVIQKHGQAASWRHYVPALFVASLMLVTPLAVAFAFARWLIFVELVLYCAFSVVASFLAAKSSTWDVLPLMPVVFATYHMAYGLGFLLGIWDFLIVKRKARRGMRALTR